jgi:hypothetical protein
LLRNINYNSVKCCNNAACRSSHKSLLRPWPLIGAAPVRFIPQRRPQQAWPCTPDYKRSQKTDFKTELSIGVIDEKRHNSRASPNSNACLIVACCTSPSSMKILAMLVFGEPGRQIGLTISCGKKPLCTTCAHQNQRLRKARRPHGAAGIHFWGGSFPRILNRETET